MGATSRGLKLHRPAAWLAGAALLAALGAAAIWAQRQGVAARVRPAAPRVGAPLGPASLFDPAILVEAPATAPGAGAAFSVAGRGVWLTARHVVEGCPRVVIVAAPGRGVLARTVLTPGRETAVLFTQGGAPPLAIAPAGQLRRAELAFHPGFPHGRPGEAASRLIDRDTLIVHGLLRGRGVRAEPVLAWAETGRTPGLSGPLTGISGAPALDSEGRVVGVTVAEAPRRGRLYTTTPSSLRGALAAAGVRAAPAGAALALTPANYGSAAAGLRASLSVAEVVCLPAR